MAGKEWAVFTVMCMLHDGKGNILVEDRRSSHWPGIAFPGGHVEPGESFVQAAVREMQEETGLDIQNPVLCGVKQFQTGDGARYVVFLFRADRFTGRSGPQRRGKSFGSLEPNCSAIPWPQISQRCSACLNLSGTVSFIMMTMGTCSCLEAADDKGKPAAGREPVAGFWIGYGIYMGEETRFRTSPSRVWKINSPAS